MVIYYTPSWSWNTIKLFLSLFWIWKFMIMMCNVAFTIFNTIIVVHDMLCVCHIRDVNFTLKTMLPVVIATLSCCRIDISIHLQQYILYIDFSGKNQTWTSFDIFSDGNIWIGFDCKTYQRLSLPLCINSFCPWIHSSYNQFVPWICFKVQHIFWVIIESE